MWSTFLEKMVDGAMLVDLLGSNNSDVLAWICTLITVFPHQRAPAVFLEARTVASLQSLTACVPYFNVLNIASHLYHRHPETSVARAAIAALGLIGSLLELMDADSGSGK